MVDAVDECRDGLLIACVRARSDTADVNVVGNRIFGDEDVGERIRKVFGARDLTGLQIIARHDLDPSVRCIVLGANGRHFSTGADLTDGGYLDEATGKIDRAAIQGAKAEARSRLTQGYDSS